MSKLKDLVRYENANSALAFRATSYGANDGESLLIDLLALANAKVSGRRLLVLGVHDQLGGERRIEGVDLNAITCLAASYKQTARDFIQPTLTFSISSLVAEDRTLAVIVLRNCEAQPYVLAKDYSPRLRAGTSWIRRGSRHVALEQDDLEKLFGAGPTARPSARDLRVSFSGPAALEKTVRAGTPTHRGTA